MQILKHFRFLKDKEKAHHLLITLFVLFIAFTALVYFLPTTIIDIEFSEEVQEQSGPVLDFLMKAISWFGKTPVALTTVFATALAFYLFRFRNEALFVVSTLAASLITFGIKFVIDRPRPTKDLVNIVQVAKHQSFPSGHTAHYVVFFGFLIYLMLRLTNINKVLRVSVIVFSLFLIVTVPLSRVYLGAHWFTDVAGGFVLGLMVLYAIIRFYLKTENKKSENDDR